MRLPLAGSSSLAHIPLVAAAAFVSLLGACGPQLLPGQGFADFGVSVDDLPMAQPDMAKAGKRFQFVLKTIHFPINKTDSAIDLNGDGASFPDNQLGVLNAAMINANLPDLNSAQATAIFTGEVLDLLSVSTSDPTFARDPVASATLLVAVQQGPPNFDGNDVFTVQNDVTESTLPGDLTAKNFTGPNPVKLTKVQDVEIQLVLGASVRVNLPVTAATLKFTISPTAIMSGQLNGAVHSADVTNILIPALASNLNVLALASPCDADCTTIRKLFPPDPTSHAITPTIVAKSATLQNALLPDVQLFDAKTGAWAPSADNRYKDSFSIGLGFTAVAATFAQ